MRITKDVIAYAQRAAIKNAGLHEKEKQLCARKSALSLKLLPFVWESKASQETLQNIKFDDLKAAMSATLIDREKMGLCIAVSVHQTSDIDVNINGWTMTLSLYGNFIHRGLSRNILTTDNWVKDLPEIKFPSSGQKAIIDNIAARDELAKINEQHHNLIKDAESINISVEAALKKVTTVKKLLQVWPEAEAILPPSEVKAVSTALALPVADLNKMIGLPKSGE